jgi:hypothetical protein
MANLDNRSEAFKLWERSLAKFAPGMFTTVLVSVESEPVPLAMLSLGLIGNASGKNSDNEVELDPRRFR